MVILRKPGKILSPCFKKQQFFMSALQKKCVFSFSIATFFIVPVVKHLKHSKYIKSGSSNFCLAVFRSDRVLKLKRPTKKTSTNCVLSLGMSCALPAVVDHQPPADLQLLSSVHKGSIVLFSFPLKIK